MIKLFRLFFNLFFQVSSEEEFSEVFLSGIQVKALFNDLQVFPLVQYLEDNLTLFDKRYLK